MKKLIYFTIGNNINYLNIAKLCIDSLNQVGYDGDLLFITNLEKEILNQLHFKNKVFFHNIKESNLLHSSANKIIIYKFNEISNYDKIIYCDLDVLWCKTPENIFEMVKEDKIYMSDECDGLISNNFWGGNLLSSEEKKEIDLNKIKGKSAGFFAFNKNMVNYFEELNKFFNDNINKAGVTLEQPFINVFFYRKNLIDNTLSANISHFGYTLETFDGDVLHFAGGPGSYEIKYEKMKKFLNKNKNGNY